MILGHLSNDEIREELRVALGLLQKDWWRLVQEIEELELGSSRAFAGITDLADVEIPDVAAVNLPIQNHGYGIEGEGRDLDLFIGLALSVGLSVLCVIYSYWL